MLNQKSIPNKIDIEIAKEITKIILLSAEKNCKKRIVIGGPMGARTKERSFALQTELFNWGYTSKLVSLDDLYRVGYKNRQAWRELYGIENVGRYEIDWNMVDIITQDFRMDFPVWMPRIDNKADSYEWVNWQSNMVDFLIVEGLYACFLKDAVHRIYIDMSIEEIYKEYEKLSKNKNEKKNWRDDFNQKVLNKEYQEASASKDNANIFIDFIGETHKIKEENL